MQKSTFNFLIHDDEREALEELARRDRVSSAEVLRRLLREKAKSRGLWPPAGAARGDDDDEDV